MLAILSRRPRALSLSVDLACAARWLLNIEQPPWSGPGPRPRPENLVLLSVPRFARRGFGSVSGDCVRRAVPLGGSWGPLPQTPRGRRPATARLGHSDCRQNTSVILPSAVTAATLWRRFNPNASALKLVPVPIRPWSSTAKESFASLRSRHLQRPGLRRANVAGSVAHLQGTSCHRWWPDRPTVRPVAARFARRSSIPSRPVKLVPLRPVGTRLPLTDRNSHRTVLLMVNLKRVSDWIKRWEALDTKFTVDLEKMIEEWPDVAREQLRKPANKRTPPAVVRPGSDGKAS